MSSYRLYLMFRTSISIVEKLYIKRILVTIKDDISHISKIFWEDRLDN